MRKAFASLVIVSFALLLAGADSARAHRLLYIFDTPNPQTNGGFGFSVATGDVDGDLKADIAVGAFDETVGGNAQQGRVYVYSGNTGAIIWTLTTPNPQPVARFGAAVALGDVNGDGLKDIIVGAPYETVAGFSFEGRAYVFDGFSGLLIRTLIKPGGGGSALFGMDIAYGDVNGDFLADIGVSAPLAASQTGRAYVFDGGTGNNMYVIMPPNPQAGAEFGHAIAMGDYDGDGKADMSVTAHLETVNSYPGQGRAYVFNGPNGALLATLDTPNPQTGGFNYFGEGIAMGDVNGDGKYDVVTGATYEAARGRAYVYAGGTGSLLWTLTPPASAPAGNNLFGESFWVRDVNSDGRWDILAGARYEDVAGNTSQGRAYLFDGASGSLMYGAFTTSGPAPNSGFGYALDMGDVDGDARADIVIGALSETVGGQSGQGRVYVFWGDTICLPALPYSDCDGDGVEDTIDDCPTIYDPAQLNNDGQSAYAWIADGAGPEGATLGGDVCDSNDDNDGCSDATELGLIASLGGDRDPQSPWDFADMWVPSLPASGIATGSRNRAVTIGDALAVLPWIGAVLNGSANTNGRIYNNDSNANGVMDGVEYDRTPSVNSSKPWQLRAPNGAISIQDAIVVLPSIGHQC